MRQRGKLSLTRYHIAAQCSTAQTLLRTRIEGNGHRRRLAALSAIHIPQSSASASMRDRDIGHTSAAETVLSVSLTDQTPRAFPQTAGNCASFGVILRDHKIQLNQYVNLAGGLGFEPRLAESESACRCVNMAETLSFPGRIRKPVPVFCARFLIVPSDRGMQVFGLQEAV
jgi:hypothetical protein